MTSEQLIAIATPLTVIVSIVLQKLDNRKAGHERRVVQDKLKRTNSIVDAKLNVMAASSNGAMLVVMRDRADAYKQLAEIHGTPDSWKRYEASERSVRDYEARQQKIVEAIKQQVPIAMVHSSPEDTANEI